MNPSEQAAFVGKIRDRCKKDPIFWAFRYVKTRDEHDKTTPVKRLPKLTYLEALLHEFHTGPRLIYVAKSRQLMVSWMLAITGLPWMEGTLGTAESSIFRAIDSKVSALLLLAGYESGPVMFNNDERTTGEDVISLLKEAGSSLAEADR